MTRVIFIMIDGLRPDAISPTHTPNLHRMLSRSAYTLKARSVVPSITLPCHTSIFHSVPPSRHGILDNDWHSMSRPVTGLVEHLKAHGKRSGFVYNWEQLRDLNRPGHLYSTFFIDTAYQFDGDMVIAQKAVEQINTRQHDFLFVYFGTVDIAGHTFGWMAEGYLKQARLVDDLVGQVVNAGGSDTTFIIHSDHGGYERDHGRDIPEDMTIPWMMSGPNIKSNYVIQQPVSLLDTAPTIAYLLGVPAHSQWEGEIVAEAFQG